MSLREVNEFNASEARMFACAATDDLNMPRFIGKPWETLPVGQPVSKHVLRLKGTETDSDVGMAYVKVFNDCRIEIHVVLDYNIPERLVVENGELGIEIDYAFQAVSRTIGIGRESLKKTKVEIDDIVPQRATLVRIGANTPVGGCNGIRLLKQVPWRWDF